jgi:serine/threonine protein kinase
VQVHRDLKPENLLFTDRSQTATLKLIDFGMAKFVRPGESLHDWCGTPEFQAPEVVRRTGYDTKADVWSAGVILYILLFGYPPFRDRNRMRLYTKVAQGKFEFPADEAAASVSPEGAKPQLCERCFWRDGTDGLVGRAQRVIWCRVC